MGRCQGRLCASAAAEILACSAGMPLAEVGRLRGQPPVKPFAVTANLPEQRLEERASRMPPEL
jgi:hypothetical protein